MKLDALRIGDVLIEENVHTMLYVGPHGDARHAMVDAYHAAGQQSGVAVVNMEEITDRIWKDCTVYRSANEDVAATAADYAKSWATHEVKTAMAPERRVDSTRKTSAKYDNRRLGVQIELNQIKAGGVLPAFEYDAFYRAVKWAKRRDEPFSHNRGTTCCAFVIACYQAASVWEHTYAYSLGKSALIEAAYLQLRRHRKAKPTVTDDDYVETHSGSKISKGCLRSHSNAGFSDAHGLGTFVEFIDRWLWFLTASPTQLSGKTLEEVFTVVMLVDAKFIHSSSLQRRLEDHEIAGDQWNKMGTHEKARGKLNMAKFSHLF